MFNPDEPTPVIEPVSWLALRLWARFRRLYDYQRIIGGLPTSGQHDGGLRPVRISRIVGTVGRAEDFDRHFRPRRDDLLPRWKAVAQAIYAGITLPPVELIQVGELYFVVDGHHRISVLRHLGQSYVDAHVIEVQTPLDIRTTAEFRRIDRRNP